MPNIMLTAQFRNAEFASSEREQGLEKLRSLGTIIPEPSRPHRRTRSRPNRLHRQFIGLYGRILRSGRGFAHRRPLGRRL